MLETQRASQVSLKRLEKAPRLVRPRLSGRVLGSGPVMRRFDLPPAGRLADESHPSIPTGAPAGRYQEPKLKFVTGPPIPPLVSPASFEVRFSATS
jgi:hypothetical protein